jgi:hypothetical protein
VKREDGPRDSLGPSIIMYCIVFYFVQGLFAITRLVSLDLDKGKEGNKRRQTDGQPCPIAVPQHAEKNKNKRKVVVQSVYKLPHAFRSVSRPVPRDGRAVLLHDSDDLDLVAVLLRPGRRPRSDMRPHHILVVDHGAIEDFDGLVVAAFVGMAAEEVHADAVALLHHRLALLARRDGIPARLVVASNRQNAAAGTGAAAGRGEDAGEYPREA